MPVSYLKRLAADNSKLAKEAIVKEAYDNKCGDFFEAMKLAYDPLISFGVAEKVIPEEAGHESAFGAIMTGSVDTSFKGFQTLCQKLIDRELTGHDARDTLQAFASECDPETWNILYRNILLKDMRAGFSDRTINKTLKKEKADKKWMIPVFECQLAQPQHKHLKHMIGKKIIDYKYDGARFLIVIRPNGSITVHTRNGKINTNFPHVTESLSYLCKKIKEPIVLDGEIMGSDFRKLMKMLNRKSAVDTTSTVFQIFDYIPLKDFNNAICEIPQLERLKTLEKLLGKIDGKPFHIVEYTLVDLDTEEGQAKREELYNNALDLGLEGIMIKNPDAPYECRRSVNWMKQKPTLTLDLKIVELELGDAGKSFSHCLGRLHCIGKEDGKEIEVAVGGGFTEELREEFWDRRKELVGFIAEIEADAITKSSDSDTYSLRFPRFKRLRGNVAGEKI